jgi:hypothetical protein
MATEKKFITVKFDNHNQKTETQTNANTPLGYTIALETGTSGPHMQTKIRHVKSLDFESLVIDVEMNKTGSWLFLRNGSMSLIADSENIKLDCKESYSDTKTFYESGVREVVYYVINQDILNKICSANKLQIRINADSSYIDIANKENSLKRFQVMCQQFYNNFYDNSKYLDSLNVDLKPKGGCFIATAAMGSYDHPVVMDLRMFRDNWLLKRDWGVSFTKWYYIYGAKVAKHIEKSIFMKKVAYLLIVKPLHFISNKLK